MLLDGAVQFVGSRVQRKRCHQRVGEFGRRESMDVGRLVSLVAPYTRAVRIDRMHQVERNRHIYEAAGLLHAMEPGFFDATETALREGFARHGVSIDELDDLAPLITADSLVPAAT